VIGCFHIRLRFIRLWRADDNRNDKSTDVVLDFRPWADNTPESCKSKPPALRVVVESFVSGLILLQSLPESISEYQRINYKQMQLWSFLSGSR
jgi:hypothetical protein